MSYRIYDMHHGAICTVTKKGVSYLSWLHAFAAGRLEYASGGW